ncbi:hypothetical protein G7046_g2059 [Stylonectria norvegica]|nr:hypothetical protein G7046_g2059 [Stylonectria norvegica]
MPRKSGTGCVTCRIRRVKCDEAKPACQRCVVSKRQCDGYLPEDSTVTRRQLAVAVRGLSIVGPVSAALSNYPRHRSRSTSPAGFPLFDVFRHSTAPSTAAFLPSDFWTRELLQLAHLEPAVWHATIALGALHQRRDLLSLGGNESRLDHLQRQANENHARAITCARELKDPTKLLALSLAFVSITSMMGRWKEHLVHMMAGHRLMGQSNNAASSAAADMLTRLDLQAMTFSDSRAPYPYRDAAWLTKVDTDMRVEKTIDSYSQAGTTLFALFRRLILLSESVEGGHMTDEEFAPLMLSVESELATWELKMSAFERRNPNGGPWALAIRLYHLMLRTFVQGGVFGPESRWDALLGNFEHIMACAEELLPEASRAL